jgi:hypothetical protein
VYVAAGDAMFAPFAANAPPPPTQRVEKRMSMFFRSGHVKPVDGSRTTRDRLHRDVQLESVCENGSVLASVLTTAFPERRLSGRGKSGVSS